MSLTLSLMPHQTPFVTDFKHRFVGLKAGYGTGKSVAFCNKGILSAKRNPGKLGALLEPVSSMVETDLKPSWEAALDSAGVPWEHESKSHMIYSLNFHGQAPSRVQLMAAENHNRLRGKNLAWWGVDEFDTIQPMALQRAVLDQLLARLRAGYNESTEQGFFVSTPEGFRVMWEFFVKEVEDEQKLCLEEGREYVPDRKLYTARTIDNYLLKPSYINTLRKQYPPQLLEAYLNGEFVNLTRGSVYSSFDKTGNATDQTAKYFLDLGYTPHLGCDFNNFKNGGGSGTISFIVNDVFYTVDEIIGTRKTKELCSIVKQRYGDVELIGHPDKSGGQDTANSEKSNIQYLHEAGFDVIEQDSLGHSANPDLIDCVNCVNGRLLNDLGERRVKINPATCPTLFSAIQRQAFDDRGLPTKDGKLDGILDAFRYPIWNVWGTGRRGVRTGSVNG